MPCTQCMAPYTALRKEQGCSKCGFGFCSNCLKHKAIIPGLVDRPVSVCVQCYRKLTEPNAENRLDKLKQELADIQLDRRELDIDERLAALRGVSVEEIRNPSLMFARKRGEQHVESAKDLIEKAHDEIRIETKWDPVKDLERRYNKYHNIEVNRDDDQMEEKHFANLNEKNPYGQSAAAASSSATNDDIVMGENTVQEMKDLKRTLISAEQESMDAGAVVAANDRSLKLEMKKFAKLTRQGSVKNERITEELGKFWERNLDKYDNGGNKNNNGNKDGNEIDEEELQKIILEAEKAENEVHETVKESKKVRPKGDGFLSKFFGHSSRQ